MSNHYKIGYSIDIVFCIDCTSSMEDHLGFVKQKTFDFCQDVRNCVESKGGEFEQFRVRVVAFRDYIAHGENAMLVTDFLNLPEESEEFTRCVRSLKASGGGDDEPEDGLEALAYAIRSEWDTEGMKRRHVIVVWTDATTHPLGFGKNSSYYPKGMARNFQELSAWWGGCQQKGFMDNHAKRLILFAPDEPAWNIISENWENVLHFPSAAGRGLSKLEYDQIIDTIFYI